SLLTLTPRIILDLGCGAGVEADLLSQCYPDAVVVGLDACGAPLFKYAPCRSFLAAVGDAGHLPYQGGVFDLVISNLLLPWCDVDKVLGEVARVLRPGGALVFATLGPDTLCEAHAAWNHVDTFAHVHDFTDMHDLGDALIRHGFVEPVMDAQMLGLTFADIQGLVRDLRALGGTNALTARRRTLTGKHRWQAFKGAYPFRQTDGGRVRATFELVYAMAWARSGSRGNGSGIHVPIPQLS
ncbi:MAG: methyltransferase domain-containing protein, partial [Arenicellales bacterium]|nr:methyltransferase domain-containing protein [Arenicellales bacterium]